MSQNDFKKAQFEEALKVTKKIKTNLKPFLQRYSKSDKTNSDISAIWQSIQILYVNLTSPAVDPLIKMNSMFGVKCIIDTGDYICHSLIQAFIFPIIKQGAHVDLKQKQQERGINFFTGSKQSASYGYNYVKLCTQMMKALASMKPSRLYFNEETKDPSQYRLSQQALNKQLKQALDFVFFKQLNDTPDKLRKTYISKLRQFNQNEQATQNYEKFIQQKFAQQIKTNFQGHKLDLRQLIKIGDCYISQSILRLIQDVFEQAKSCNFIRQSLDIINLFVLSGDHHSRFFLHGNDQIKKLVKSVINIQSPSQGIDRGQHFLPDKKGTSEDRKQLYCDFLRCLELWAHTFPKNSFKDQNKPSKISKYYKILKQNFRFQFPGSAMLSKSINQVQQNAKKRQDTNRILLQEVQNQDFPDQLDDSIIVRPKKSPDLPLSSKQSIQQNLLGASKIGSTQKINNSLKSEPISNKKIQTPGNVSQSQGQKFLQRLKKAEAAFQKLTSNQKQLPTNMKYLQQETQKMQTDLESLNVRQDQFQQFMGKLFDLSEKFQKAQPVYEDYKKNKIDYSKFCSKVNGKMGSSKIISQPKLQSNKVQLSKQKNVQSSHVLKNSQKQLYQPKITVNQPSHKQILNHPSNAPSQKKIIESYTKIKQNSKGQIVSYQMRQKSIQSHNQSHKSITKHINDYQVAQSNSKQPQNPKYSGKSIKESQKFVQSKRHIDQQKHKLQESISKKAFVDNSPIARIQHTQHKPNYPIYQSNKQLKERSNQRVQFDQSQMGQSRFTNSIAPVNNHKEFVEYSPASSNIKYEESKNEPNQFILSEREQYAGIPDQRYKKFNRKINQGFQKTQKQAGSHVVDYKPITAGQQYNINVQSKQFLNSPIKNQQLRINDDEDLICINDNQFIQGPSLNPLECSYHDFEQIEPKRQKIKNFKDVISNKNMFIKTNKRENLFKLESQSGSLIRPVSNISKGSRVQSRVNVSQLLDQRNKKYQIQVKLVQQNKEMKIQQLKSKLRNVQREKSQISSKLRDKQLQIRTMRQNSEIDPVRSKVDHYTLIDDQNLVMKKLAANNTAHSMAHLPKKLIDSSINYSRILASGQLINTKMYSHLFEKFKNQKQKKVHMKNKQLLYKDRDLQIGYMGHIQRGNIFKITIFITPQNDFQFEAIKIQCDNNLNIKYDSKSGYEILKGRQHRQQFQIYINKIPYQIPIVNLLYRMNHSNKKASFVLPCAFHKFFTIKQVESQQNFNQKFGKQKVIRGQQIPYSKKILKNPDLIKDFLPHIEKLNKGQPNDLGEICFGGEASYKQFKFLIKISIKPNQFLYIQVIDKMYNPQERKIIDFYVATVNHFLMKQINWQNIMQSNISVS